ncbi:hypothetical protein ACIRRH_34895 [Kitasatospora sp. NPDC101235]
MAWRIPEEQPGPGRLAQAAGHSLRTAQRWAHALQAVVEAD